MAFFLAVDAGGTKTDYGLADDSRILARARTGTIKRMRTDAVAAEKNLDEALERLAAEAGISMRSITRTCIGTAGERVPLVVDWLQAAFTKRVTGNLLIIGDVEIALDAAFPGAAGVLVLAGTGSNVAGRTAAGSLIGAGGWGPVLADQGSGHRIGLEGLRAVFTAIDEDEPTTLGAAILAFWKLESIDGLVEFANHRPSPDFSQLTRVVVQCALEGDAVALRTLRREGCELAKLAMLVIHRLQRSSDRKGWVPPVAMAGSILEKVPLLREALIGELERQCPGVQVLPGVVDPLDGAVWRARHPMDAS